MCGSEHASDGNLVHGLYFAAMGRNTQTSGPGDPIIGIDLGTTNSLVAFCDEAGPRILPDEQGRRMLPSVVRFGPGGSADAVGHDARAHAVEFANTTVFSIKRLMGRGPADVESELKFLPYEIVSGEHHTARVRIPPDTIISPQQVSAIILERLRRQAEAALGVEVSRAVITVPAYFDDAQRQATRDAGRIAGLQVVRIVNEPTAAALAYNLGQRHDDATVAVYDLGGGTFDISILRLQHTEAGSIDQVLATDGDTHLGGDDVDHMIVDLIQRDIRAQFGEQIEFPSHTRQAFRNFAEAAKIRLSEHEAATIEVDIGGGRTFTRQIMRDELEAMIRPWVDRTIACTRRAIAAAGLSAAKIDRVILVGELFEREPYTALNPDEVVALGAGVQGAILGGRQRDMLLLDVIPLSLGIETMGGAVAKLIMANTTIPAQATEMFSTYVDNQTNVKIHLLQGERELVADCRSLGEFDLQGIPPMPATLPKIEVTFLVDANGILSVRAVEKRSEKAAQIQIVPNHGLTRGEVAQMEAESFAHARHDMTAHRLIDLHNQARLDIRAVERQLEKVGGEIDADYRTQIEQLVTAVRRFLDAGGGETDVDAFEQALTAMDESALRLAEVAITMSLRE